MSPIRSDAASLVAAYRLAISLEPALMLCTAAEIGGDTVQALLTNAGVAEAPALVVELARVTPGPTG
jgi:hypothetical protein